MRRRCERRLEGGNGNILLVSMYFTTNSTLRPQLKTEIRDFVEFISVVKNEEFWTADGTVVRRRPKCIYCTVRPLTMASDGERVM